ncbi:MFS transporter [Metabacillus arenae]|uniref:MFS transporter n=1 Tax=Metabacillus arenae TaxID=2771434 RepID=A0A926S0W6_9BACI|nr:MFS transporter [Metabacillus arenae]MBD1380434.1 MFS transporter [Metabacillus arenae]
MKIGKFDTLKYPLLLLSGIGISNIGAWVYLIALNLTVLEMTGSPMAVTALYILIPIAALCTNFWAGSLIDRANKRLLMTFLDIFRAVCIFLLPFLPSIWFIYIFVFLINMAGAIFATTSMTYMTKLIPKNDRQRFNALRSIIDSGGFLIGPSIAGLLFLKGTPFLAIQLNAVALFISGFIIMLLPNVEKKEKAVTGPKISWSLIKKDWLEVTNFSKTSFYVALVYLLISGVTVFMTAIDSLEASFAKEVLVLSDSAYGFLVSIAGGGIIAGSVINTLFAKKFAVHMQISIGTIVTAFGYLLFAFSNSFLIAALSFFLLSFAISFANIGFITFYQNNVPVEIMGRFGSFFGMIEAVLIIIFTTTFGVMAEIISIRPVVVLGSCCLLFLGMIICGFVFQSSKKKFFLH